MFFSIQGCDEWEGNKPSWFNQFKVDGSNSELATINLWKLYGS